MSDERKDRLDGRAVVLLLGCCAVWGLAQVAAKVSLAEVPPLTQGALRSLGAALLLALWARARGLPLWQRDGSARAGLLLGVLFAAEFACLFIGLQFTSASRMVVFLYCSPFVVALLMPFLARSERLDRVQVLGLVVAFVGVVVTYSEGFDSTATAGPLQWLGDALGLAGAVLWALTTLALRASRLARALPEKTLMYQLVVSALALGLAAPLASVVLLGEPATARLLLGLVAVCAGIALVNRTPRAN